MRNLLLATFTRTEADNHNTNIIMDKKRNDENCLHPRIDPRQLYWGSFASRSLAIVEIGET